MLKETEYRAFNPCHYFINAETVSPEKLVIAWINAAVMTLKSYIMSSKNHQLVR